MKFLFLVFMISIFSNPAQGLQLIENFTTSNYWDQSNSSGVWNFALGYFHPPIVIDPSLAAGINENSPAIDVGNGSDGPFDVNTYSKFGTINGNVITIDTNAHPYLQFTYFNLASGWTVRGSGANALWFKVLGNFTNAGTIDCSGGNGDPTNAVATIMPAGGVGRCGGGDGGSGGYASAAAVTGGSGCTVAPCGALSGGSGGTTQATNAGGGGGGGGYYSAVSGATGTGTGPGAGGGSVLDPSMTKIGSASGGPGGGSGGGGGGNATGVGISAGGGGGAGGGVIRISCVGDFTNTGTITANGGAGGSGSGADRAGAGGGGAGGSIWILSAGNYSNVGGAVTAQAGGGGGGVGGGGNGGAGASGRTWITFGKNFSGASETPTANMADLGLVRFSEQSYTFQSLPYDLRNTSPTYRSFILNAQNEGSGTATVLVAGSSDNFVNDNTGFIPAASVASLSGKRFFKFKITFHYVSFPVATTIPIVNPGITSLILDYDGSKKSDFNFEPACGYMGGPGEALFFLFLCLSGGFIMKKSKVHQRIPNHKYEPASNQ